MDTRLTPLPPLTTIVVTGTRRKVREAFRWLVLLGLAAAFIGLCFETHRECDSWSLPCRAWGPSHHLWSDVGPALHLAVLFAGGLTWLGRSRRMVAGILLAAATTVVVFGTLFVYVMIHFLSSVDGDGLGAPGLLVALFGALAQIVVEPIVTARERRHVIAGDPVLAHARVVRT